MTKNVYTKGDREFEYNREWYRVEYNATAVYTFSKNCHHTENGDGDPDESSLEIKEINATFYRYDGETEEIVIDSEQLKKLRAILEGYLLEIADFEG